MLRAKRARARRAKSCRPRASARRPGAATSCPASAAAARSACSGARSWIKPPQRVVDDDELVDAGAAAIARVAALAATRGRVEREIRAAGRARPAIGLRPGVGAARVRQAGQSVRTSRCASTPSRLDASRYGSTPMSARRVIALAASLVCSVASTRWPVSEACTAICAVSRSRISPIMMMSGSWRRIARSARAKVEIDLRIDLRLADAVERVLDRILDRHHVERAARQPRQRRVERRRLAGAGRAGDEHDAVRLAYQAVDRRERRRAHAERREIELRGILVEQAQHDALAGPRRQRRHAHVDQLVAELQARGGRPAAAASRRCRGSP